jgi:hypothetical protein
MALSEFERAFKAARAMGDSDFEFRGKKFNTKLKDDMPAPKSEKVSTGATFKSDLSGRQKQMEIDRLREEDKPLEGVHPETALPPLRALRGLAAVSGATKELRDRVEPYLRGETPALPAPRRETPALPAPRSEPKALGGPKPEREYTPRREAAVGENPPIKQEGREVSGMNRGQAAGEPGGVSAGEASRFGQGATKNPRGMSRSEDRNPDMKKGGKVKAFAKGGSVSSASSRGDGCAQRGKTRGRMV